MNQSSYLQGCTIQGNAVRSNESRGPYYSHDSAKED